MAAANPDTETQKIRALERLDFVQWHHPRPTFFGHDEGTVVDLSFRCIKDSVDDSFGQLKKLFPNGCSKSPGLSEFLFEKLEEKIQILRPGFVKNKHGKENCWDPIRYETVTFVYFIIRTKVGSALANKYCVLEKSGCGKSYLVQKCPDKSIAQCTNCIVGKNDAI
jgi:hypothetical protein